jgi:very-short-patch-repair endonuclease
MNGVLPALELADSASESALESATRGILTLAGVLPARLQFAIRVSGRSYRADFAWPEKSVVLEADGLIKYSRAEDMWAEKRRQSDLQAAGFEVWRCTWADVATAQTSFVLRLRERLI